MNKEREKLCDFLIDTDCCVLNGRNTTKNNNTFIGQQGHSVVDYCLIPYERLDIFTDFKVTLETDLFNSSNLLGVIDPETSHPDHSLLTWNFAVTTDQKGPYTMKEQDIRITFTV